MANNTFSANDDVLNMKGTEENDVKIDMDFRSQEPNNMSAKCCGMFSLNTLHTKQLEILLYTLFFIAGQPENKPELCKVGLFPVSAMMQYDVHTA